MADSKTHTVTIEEQKRLTATGVISVDNFTEQTINVTLESGKMCVTGDKLKINAFSKNTYTLGVDGVIYSVRYSVKKPPLKNRLFK